MQESFLIFRNPVEQSNTNYGWSTDSDKKAQRFLNLAAFIVFVISELEFYWYVDEPFRQQKMRSWHFILTPMRAIAIFFTVGKFHYEFWSLNLQAIDCYDVHV